MPVGKTCRVRFSKNHKIKHIPMRKELSQEEHLATWMSSSDYERSIEEAETTKALMVYEEDEHLIDDKVVCSRGLEADDILRSRLESNAFIQRLVLHQFSSQAMEGVADGDKVAMIYRECALPAVKKAIQLGRLDAENAILYLQEACHG